MAGLAGCAGVLGALPAGVAGFALAAGRGVGLAGTGFFFGLARFFAASKSIVPNTFRPGTLRPPLSSTVAGAAGADGGGGGVPPVTGVMVGAGAADGADGRPGSGGGGAPPTRGDGGTPLPGAIGGGGGGGGGGTAVGLVLNSRASAFFLSDAALAKAARTTSSISGVNFEVGLLSISKPFVDRCSTILEVPTFNSFATLISRLLIRSIMHNTSGNRAVQTRGNLRIP